jgi:photosystem II stability/assembly factor-like uncharacterized protein
VFKTTDGGKTWTTLTRGLPDDGKTWTTLTRGLPDDGKTGAIDMVMDPEDPHTLYVSFWQRLRQPWRFDSGGPNGGIFKSTDGGRSWNKLLKRLPTGEMGRVGLAISRGNPRTLMAVVEHGFQPARTIMTDGQSVENPDYKDMTRLGAGIYRSEDGGRSWLYVDRLNSRPFYYISIAESPRTPGLLFVGTDDGNVQITRDGGNNWTNVRPDVPGVPGRLWVSRGEASHFDEGTAYLTFDGHRSDNFTPYAFKTTDYGKTWTSIAGNIPDGQPIYVIREDLKNRNLLFVGTEFTAFCSIDGGKQRTSLRRSLPTVAVPDLRIHPRDNDLIAATHGRGIWIMDDISALQQTTPDVLGSEFHLFDHARPATRWLQIERGGYGRGDLYFKGENPPSGALVQFYLKSKPEGQVRVDIADGTGPQKTTFVIDAPQAGINRLMWDLRVDPAPAQVKQAADLVNRRIETALKRQDLTAEQQAGLGQALKEVTAVGTVYRKVRELQGRVAQLLRPASGGAGGPGGVGGGPGGMGFGGPGAGGTADPGTYALTLTVNGKSSAKRISVRLDPMVTGSEQR